MTDQLSTEDSNKLFNDVTKAMQDDDGTKLSELLAQEAPEKGQPIQDPPDDDKEDQPDTTEDEDTDSPPDSDDSDDEADTPKEEDESDKDTSKDKELTPEAKKLAELQEQLEAAKKDNQALRSQAGRVPNIQRRLAELDKKLEALTSPSSQTSAKIKPKVDKLLEGIKETDPALAEAIAAAMETAIEGVDEESRTREKETLTLLREQEQLEYQEEQAQRLLSMYPNAPQVFASPHWAEWKKTQPKHILELAGSTSADAVAMAFEQYAKDMVTKYPDLVQKKEEASPDKVVDPGDADKATKLEQERQRKKKSEANLDTSKSGARAKEPTDPEALFKLFSEQIAKEIKG